MPSPFSSQGSVDDALALADRLGIRTLTLPIAGVMGAFEATLAGAFAGRPPDVTEENIQARARGNLLMALSNKFGSLLLTTGNKSELAVGYCTLYGDMSGGLAVIADLPKTRVYRVSEWVNREREIIPRVDPHQGAVRRAAPEPDRPGLAAALRRARRDPRAAHRALSVAGGDRRRRLRRGDGGAGAAPGAARRSSSGARPRRACASPSGPSAPAGACRWHAPTGSADRGRRSGADAAQVEARRQLGEADLRDQPQPEIVIGRRPGAELIAAGLADGVAAGDRRPVLEARSAAQPHRDRVRRPRRAVVGGGRRGVRWRGAGPTSPTALASTPISGCACR